MVRRKTPRAKPDRRTVKTLIPGFDLPTSPPVAVQVVSVQVMALDTLRWTFDSDVTGCGANCAQLEAHDGGGGGEWHAPDEIGQTADDQIDAYYASGAFNGSSLWRVTSAPAGVTFAGGELDVPQTGSVA